MSDRLGIDLIKQLLAIPKIKVPILYPSEYRARLTIVASLYKFKTGQNTGNYLPWGHPTKIDKSTFCHFSHS